MVDILFCNNWTDQGNTQIILVCTAQGVRLKIDLTEIVVQVYDSPIEPATDPEKIHSQKSSTITTTDVK